MRNLFRSLRVTYMVLIAALVLNETGMLELWEFIPVFMFFGLLGDVITENRAILKKKEEKNYR